MKIIENNYVPPKKIITHYKTVRKTAYQLVCPRCNSMLIVDKSDLYYSDWYMGKAYDCPCCKQTQGFGCGIKKKISYEEKIPCFD